MCIWSPQYSPGHRSSNTTINHVAAAAAKSLQLCPTLRPHKTAAHQASPSLGFSRQEYWGGLPFPSPMHESEVAQSCPTPRDPTDCSLPGSSVHGIFQARVLEWVATAFSHCFLLRLWKHRGIWNLENLSLSRDLTNMTFLVLISFSVML